jgi:spore coat polysaccharide biosynthesis protein SpsF
VADFGTEQERFWAGAFGEEYSARNAGAALVPANAALLARVLARTAGVRSLVELGANLGHNLRALRLLRPALELAAVEINPAAAAALGRIEGVQVFPESLLDWRPERTWDLALVKGVLIHLAPERLPQAYDLLHRAAGRYICLAEYYNPTPVEVPYRGHAGKLFKRDFAGELLEAHADLRLVDYGFVYRRDPNFPQDDLTWFLLEKAG